MQITLTAEQAAQIARATQPVEFLAPDGRLLGVLPPAVSEDDIKEALERLASDEPRWPTSVVLERLKT